MLRVSYKWVMIPAVMAFISTFLVIQVGKEGLPMWMDQQWGDILIYLTVGSWMGFLCVGLPWLVGIIETD